MTLPEQYGSGAEQAPTATPADVSAPAPEQAPTGEAPRETDAVQQPETPQAGIPQRIVPPGPLQPQGQGLQALISVLIVALFVITFAFQAFQIPSESMEKTLLIGDYLMVDKVHFGQSGFWRHILPYRDIHRGDIIVFHYPVDPSQHFVKRVIGVPGDKIHLTDSTVYVNDVPIQESYVVHTLRNFDPYRDNFPDQSGYYSSDVNTAWHSVIQDYLKGSDLVVPPGQYFVLGDNRDRSLDSRYWGFVPRQNIVGRPLVIYLSVREEPDYENRRGASQVVTHMWQFARWKRMFHLVR
jgi:signal peptidase I